MTVGHTDTPANVQNNCLKLPSFDADTTRLFLNQVITKNSSNSREAIQPQKFFDSFLGPTSCAASIIYCFFSG